MREPSLPSPAMPRRALGRTAAGLLAAPVLLARPAVAQQRTAFDLILAAGAVAAFAEILRIHDIGQEFFAPGEFGFFVPSNDAIARLRPAQTNPLRENKEFARHVVLSHITDYQGVIDAFGGSGTRREVRTLAGGTVNIDTSVTPPRLGGHVISFMNVRATNGFCHLLEGVLGT